MKNSIGFIPVKKYNEKATPLPKKKKRVFKIKIISRTFSYVFLL